VFSTSHRADPFAAARREAGLEPAEEPRRPSPARPVAALVAAVALLAGLLLTGASPVSSAPDEISAKEDALARATQARMEADSRVASLTAEVAEVREELERLGVADELLTEELTTARRQLREYAVAAYIDGGQTEIVRASLSPEKAVALSWQSNMAFGQSVSADQAADRFEVLKEANTPARLDAAAQLDRANARLEEARFDAIQAAAHERDAESALTRARAAAAERARAEREAAQRKAAADRARARAAAAAPAPPAAPRRSGRSSVAVATPTAAPASPGRGDPTASESSTLARIRRCESGGNYGAVSASGRYRGAYQFDRSTWAGVGGSGDPAAASPAEQDYRALLLLRQRGTRPWPVCGR
jgi:hypothetical protein